MNKDEALDKALEALEHMLEDAKQERLTVEYWNECVDAITAIKQALAAPYVATPLVQEPVAWRDAIVVNLVREGINKHRARELADHFTSLTTPPAAPVQGSWHWSEAPVKTQWGHEMVVADLAIDKDNTVSVYCERDQTAKVEAMFTPPAAPYVATPLVQESEKRECMNCAAFGECNPNNDAGRCGYEPPAASVHEPVAWMKEGWGPDCGPYIEFYRDDEMGWRDRKEWTPLYTTPPAAQRTWVGLTDEEIDLFINGKGDEDDEDYVEPTGDGFGLTDADLVQLVRKSEAKLKEKNT